MCDKMSVVSFPSKFAAGNKKLALAEVLLTSSESLWAASSLGRLECDTQEAHCTAELQQKFAIWDTVAEVT